MDDWVLIFSYEHGAWWRANRLGYTADIGHAGLYSRSEAREICARATLSWEMCPNEVPVRVRDLPREAFERLCETGRWQFVEWVDD